MYKCFACVYRPEEGVEFLGTGVTDGCEPPCGSWELNLRPLEDEPVLLTARPSFSLAPGCLILGNFFAFLICCRY